MVFLSPTWFLRRKANMDLKNKGPSEFWRKRKIFKMAAHFFGRSRNCYSIAIRSVHRALMFSTHGRKLRKLDMQKLMELRTDISAKQYGITYRALIEGLTRCNIFLNRRCLADLAIWEPRTFKSLIDISIARSKQDGLKRVENIEMPSHIITRGEIK